jgi:predicted ATPase
VIVFKAVGVGKTTIVYALTKVESATAKQAKTFVVTSLADHVLRGFDLPDYLG